MSPAGVPANIVGIRIILSEVRIYIFSNTVSKFHTCAVAKSEKLWRATDNQTWLAATKASKVWFLDSPIELSMERSSILLFCLPSLIVHWPARIFHF